MSEEIMRFFIRVSDTGQYHVFEGYQIRNATCQRTGFKSYCNQVSDSVTAASLHNCITGEELLALGGKLKAKMCGPCMSHLFGEETPL